MMTNTHLIQPLNDVITGL